LTLSLAASFALPAGAGGRNIFGSWSSSFGRRNACAYHVTQQGKAVMTVNDILRHKGSHVVTIEPTATLAAAVRMLAPNRLAVLPSKSRFSGFFPQLSP
jgi:hypothetical protein